MGVPVKNKRQGGKYTQKHKGKKTRRDKHKKRHFYSSRKMHKTKARHIQAGGWNLGNLISKFPFGQDAVNIARSGETAISNVVRGIGGYKKTVSQWPSSQNKIGSRKSTKTFRKNLADIYKSNKEQVSKM